MTHVKWLPSAWQKDRLGFLEEMCELVDHVINGITHNTTGIQCYVGALRLVEWVVDASEVGDFAGTSLRVQALHISVLADFQRCGDVDHYRIVW